MEMPLIRRQNARPVEFRKLDLAEFLKLRGQLVPAVFDAGSKTMVISAKATAAEETNRLSDDASSAKLQD